MLSGSCRKHVEKSSFYDAVQVLFYDLFNDDIIISTVISYIESNPKNYDDNSILVYNELKYQFDIEVKDEILYDYRSSSSEIYKRS